MHTHEFIYSQKCDYVKMQYAPPGDSQNIEMIEHLMVFSRVDGRYCVVCINRFTRICAHSKVNCCSSLIPSIRMHALIST